MNTSKILAHVLIGFLLLWCFVESTSGASFNVRKRGLDGIKVNAEVEVTDLPEVPDLPEITTVTTADVTVTTELPVEANVDVEANVELQADLEIIEADVSLNITIPVRI